jgi:hypothetical protein
MTQETKPTNLTRALERAMKHIQPYGPNANGFQSGDDRELIEAACNSHDALVELHTAFMDFLTAKDRTNALVVSGMFIAMEEAARKAEKLLTGGE